MFQSYRLFEEAFLPLDPIFNLPGVEFPTERSPIPFPNFWAHIFEDNEMAAIDLTATITEDVVDDHVDLPTTSAVLIEDDDPPTAQPVIREVDDAAPSTQPVDGGDNVPAPSPLVAEGTNPSTTQVAPSESAPAASAVGVHVSASSVIEIIDLTGDDDEPRPQGLGNAGLLTALLETCHSSMAWILMCDLGKCSLNLAMLWWIIDGAAGMSVGLVPVNDI
jgi:hypothetical protein